MRILFLTLMMSFLSQGAFACVKLPGFADPEDYKPALKVLPNPTEETLKIDQDGNADYLDYFIQLAKQAYINSEIIDADKSLENKYKYNKFDEYSNNHIISEYNYESIDFKNQVENIKEILTYLEEIYKDSVKHQKFNKDQLCGIQLINPDGCLLGFIDDVLNHKNSDCFLDCKQDYKTNTQLCLLYELRKIEAKIHEKSNITEKDFITKENLINKTSNNDVFVRYTYRELGKGNKDLNLLREHLQKENKELERQGKQPPLRSHAEVITERCASECYDELMVGYLVEANDKIKIKIKI